MAKTPSASSELIKELVNKFGGGFHHASEKVSDWDHFGKTAFLKRYLRNDVNVCLECRVWFGEANSEKLLISFRNLASHWPAKIDNGAMRYNAELRSLFFIGADSDLFVHLGGGCDDNKEAVFVSDVEFVKHSQKMVVRRCAEIRLRVANQFFGSAANALYASARNGSFKIFGAPTNRELMKASFDFKNVISSIILEISDDFIRADSRINESSDFRIEIEDALVGPLKFGPDSVTASMRW